jgi:hypothetical protein
MYMYIHVCTMFRYVCIVLPYPGQVVRIPDALLSLYSDQQGLALAAGQDTVTAHCAQCLSCNGQASVQVQVLPQLEQGFPLLIMWRHS